MDYRRIVPRVVGFGPGGAGRGVFHRALRRRPVLVANAVLLASGLLIQALAATLPVSSSPGVLVGLGMSASLYDPAFSTLGRLYGQHARSAITQLTLFGGFASTVCWPPSAFFIEHFGWRGASLSSRRFARSGPTAS
jgi:hypothetical protein